MHGLGEIIPSRSLPAAPLNLAIPGSFGLQAWPRWLDTSGVGCAQGDAQGAGALPKEVRCSGCASGILAFSMISQGCRPGLAKPGTPHIPRNRLK